jgi:hypothetical protein
MHLLTGAKSIHILQLGSQFGRCSFYVDGVDGGAAGVSIGTNALDCEKVVSTTLPAF